ALASLAKTDDPNSSAKGVYRTTNAGKTWTYVSIAGPPGPNRDWPAPSKWGRTIFAVSQSDPGIVYARVVHDEANPPCTDPANPLCRQGRIATLAKSTDFGLTWSFLWDERVDPLTSGLGLLEGAGPRSSFGVDSQNPNYLLVGGAALYRSINGGLTWTAISSGHPDIHYIEPTRCGLWVGTDGGVAYHMRISGASYPPLATRLDNDGYRSLQFYYMAADPTSGDIVYGGTQDRGTWSRPAVGTWLRPGAGDGYEVATSDVCHRCITTAGTGDVAFYWHTDKLKGTCNAGVNDEYLSETGGFHGPILVDPLDPANEVWYFRKGRLFTFDGSCQQTQLLTINENGGFTQPEAKVRAADISINPTRRIYAGTTQGELFVVEEGSPWWSSEVELTVGSPWDDPGFGRDVEIRDVVVRQDPSFGQDVVYITLGPGPDSYGRPDGNLWKYDTLTQTWTPLGAGLPDGPILCFAIHPTDPEEFFVGTMHGVWWSRDAGATWEEHTTELPDVMVADLVMHPGTGVLYAATFGRSIWRSYPDNWTLPAGGLRAGGAPDDGFLPSNEGGLRFRTGARARVAVELYDVTGRRVRDVIDETLDSGEHSETVDVSDLTAGIYFARMRVNGLQVDSQKLVIR
ncbi:MAG: T9SS type A sorting domain-containing protein, partial [Candidatus Eisenbacteria bacterium]|nr:T9SS type A sorting domain-containing protein [Candidatus Eisenbacteria bacterium]